MTGHGGWPLNAFATPDQVPFYARHVLPAGRPPRPAGLAPAAGGDRRGLAGAARGDRAAGRADRRAPRRQRAHRARARRAGARAARHRRRGDRRPRGPRPRRFRRRAEVPAGVRDRAAARAAADGDEAALRTLRAMARGGIYDQLGGGFARYAVDAAWVVPHFEKMLYDNALLARAYLHGWQVERRRPAAAAGLLRDARLGAARAARARGRLRLRARRRLGGRRGQVLRVDAAASCARSLDDERWPKSRSRTGASRSGGNFEGRTILVRAGSDDDPPELPEIKRRLLDAREQRVRPGLDDKRLTLLERADARGAGGGRRGARARRTTSTPRAPAPTSCCASCATPDGRLLRTWKDGRAHLAGYLEDHAFLLEALLTLYEATFEPRWFAAARALADVTIAALRRRRARRLLHDRRRPRAARRAPQGPRGHADPVGQLGDGARRCCGSRG